MKSKYLPKQLKQHPDFVEYQDVIAIALDQNKFYALGQAMAELKKFLNREVD